MINQTKSELLLPVGNLNMALAAIHNGADAIYVGMPHFNARGRTADFTISELKEIIETCHLYGVRVNLAFNVVIFEEEIPEVIELLKQVLPLQPDALIMQDVGLTSLVREMAPEQIIHGSTQMTVTNFEAMNFLSDLKIKRFVLGREVSLPEIKQIKEKTQNELEVFVHGALCVAYSGQCFTSESIGGRSANRGQCAQSCRLEYDMIVDGKKVDLREKKYLVSPKDLCGISEIPELVSLGIESFKVEGRLKTPEYVASTARNYRKAIDQSLYKGLTPVEEMKAKTEMSLTYSRGFFSGWLHGVDHQDLVDGTFGAHRGIKIGRVSNVLKQSLLIEIESSMNHLIQLKNGDGLLFSSFFANKKQELGGKIFNIVKGSKANQFELSFDKSFNFKPFLVRDSRWDVYFNSDPKLTKELAASFTDKELKKRIPLSVKAYAKLGEPLKLSVRCDRHEVEVTSISPLAKAQKSPSTVEDLKKELGALSATCFRLKEIELVNDSNSDFFIHQKELKEMRREFSERLTVLRSSTNISNIPILLQESHQITLSSSREHKSAGNIGAKLNVLLREFDQVKDFVDLYKKNNWKDLDYIILDYEFGKGYTESVAILKEQRLKVAIATTRILKPNEYYNFKIIAKAKPDAILCRNLGAVYYFQNQSTDNFDLLADFSLNVTNSLTAKYLLSKNLESIMASYDLSSKQLMSLVENSLASKIEVNVHQYMPSFHMEHCVFAAFMSKGRSFRDCGKPCEKHKLELVDQFGNHHHIKADQECRNTMFNAVPQSAAKMIPDLKKYGVSRFRFEALYERGEELERKISSLISIITAGDLTTIQNELSRLNVLEKYGLSDGSHREREYQDRKK
jgi:putative protease